MTIVVLISIWRCIGLKLANQTVDSELAHSSPVANAMFENETKINEELMAHKELPKH